MVGGAKPGGRVYSTAGALVGTESKVASRVGAGDTAGATCTLIRSAAAVATCETVRPCALQSCSETPSMWTPAGDGAGSSHCWLARPWCADDSADESHVSTQNALDTGTAAKTTSTKTLIRCFQLTIRVYPEAVERSAGRVEATPITAEPYATARRCQ